MALWHDAYLYGNAPKDPNIFTIPNNLLSDNPDFDFSNAKLNVKTLQTIYRIRDPLSTLEWESKLLPSLKQNERPNFPKHFIEIYQIKPKNNFQKGSSLNSSPSSSVNSSPRSSSLNKKSNSNSGKALAAATLVKPTVLISKAGCHVLDYCARFRICDAKVLNKIESIVMERKEFGNIRAAIEFERRQIRETTQIQIKAKKSLICIELPKRLFKGLPNSENQGPTTTKSQFKQSLNPEDPIPSSLTSILSHFGPPPYPSYSSLLVMLSILFRTSEIFTSPLSSSDQFLSSVSSSTHHPSNSHSGLPLTLSTFSKSTFLVSLLLSFNADPSTKGSLAIITAIKGGWLDGIRLMVERNCEKEKKWQEGKVMLKDWLEERERRWELGINLNDDLEVSDDLGLDMATGKGSMENSSENKNKRIKLQDRISLHPGLLKEAVKQQQWEITQYFLKEKSVNPDQQIVRLLEKVGQE